MGLRKILAVGQCYVDGMDEAVLYPGWFVDLTQGATCEENSLPEIHNHVEQAKEIAQSAGHNMLCYPGRDPAETWREIEEAQIVLTWPFPVSGLTSGRAPSAPADVGRHHARERRLGRAALDEPGSLECGITIEFDQNIGGLNGVRLQPSKIGLPIAARGFTPGNHVKHGLQLVGSAALVFVHGRYPIGGAKYRHSAQCPTASLNERGCNRVQLNRE